MLPLFSAGARISRHGFLRYCILYFWILIIDIYANLNLKVGFFKGGELGQPLLMLHFWCILFSKILLIIHINLLFYLTNVTTERIWGLNNPLFSTLFIFTAAVVAVQWRAYSRARAWLFTRVSILLLNRIGDAERSPVGPPEPGGGRAIGPAPLRLCRIS